MSTTLSPSENPGYHLFADHIHWWEDADYIMKPDDRLISCGDFSGTRNVIFEMTNACNMQGIGAAKNRRSPVPMEDGAVKEKLLRPRWMSRAESERVSNHKCCLLLVGSLQQEVFLYWGRNTRYKSTSEEHDKRVLWSPHRKFNAGWF